MYLMPPKLKSVLRKDAWALNYCAVRIGTSQPSGRSACGNPLMILKRIGSHHCFRKHGLWSALSSQQKQVHGPCRPSILLNENSSTPSTKSNLHRPGSGFGKGAG